MHRGMYINRVGMDMTCDPNENYIYIQGQNQGVM